MSDTGSALWTSWFLNWFLSRFFFCFVCFSNKKRNSYNLLLCPSQYFCVQLFVDWFDQIASLDLFICCEECIFFTRMYKILKCIFVTLLKHRLPYTFFFLWKTFFKHSLPYTFITMLFSFYGDHLSNLIRIWYKLCSYSWLFVSVSFH